MQGIFWLAIFFLQIEEKGFKAVKETHFIWFETVVFHFFSLL